MSSITNSINDANVSSLLETETSHESVNTGLETSHESVNTGLETSHESVDSDYDHELIKRNYKLINSILNNQKRIFSTLDDFEISLNQELIENNQKLIKNNQELIENNNLLTENQELIENNQKLIEDNLKCIEKSAKIKMNSSHFRNKNNFSIYLFKPNEKMKDSAYIDSYMDIEPFVLIDIENELSIRENELSIRMIKSYYGSGTFHNNFNEESVNKGIVPIGWLSYINNSGQIVYNPSYIVITDNTGDIIAHGFLSENLIKRSNVQQSNSQYLNGQHIKINDTFFISFRNIERLNNQPNEICGAIIYNNELAMKINK